MTNLQEMRLKVGMTQSELAEKSGISIRVIQNYEQGFRKLAKAKYTTCLKIAEALGCDIADIV